MRPYIDGVSPSLAEGVRGRQGLCKSHCNDACGDSPWSCWLEIARLARAAFRFATDLISMGDFAHASGKPATGTGVGLLGASSFEPAVALVATAARGATAARLAAFGCAGDPPKKSPIVRFIADAAARRCPNSIQLREVYALRAAGCDAQARTNLAINTLPTSVPQE